jgi:CTP synthase (UTP-ammonia lyase)
MSDSIAIAVVGDYNAAFPGHVTIAKAIQHAGEKLGFDACVEWISTPAFTRQNVGQVLSGFHGLIAAPASPYQSFEGMLATIESGRKGRRPFYGSCGGFQHTLIEYARNVMSLPDAHSAEYGTASKNIVVVPVSCPVPGRPAGEPKLSGAVDCPETTVRILPGTKAAEIYKRDKVVEEYFCNYEANLAFQSRFDAAGLRVTGVGPNGEARVVEIPQHPWFLATLFQPQRATAPGKPHPLFVHYLRAAAQFKQANAISSGRSEAQAGVAEGSMRPVR